MPAPRARALASLALLAVVAAWGYTFVPIKEVTERWPRHWMTFVALRFWVASVAFLPWLLPPRAPAPRAAVVPGALTGLTMLLGYGLQTGGLLYTTPAIAGFITGISVVLVPVGARLLGQPVLPSAVLGLVVATVGLGVMKLGPDQRIAFGAGELLVLGCAFSFAAQILLTGRFAATVDPLRFTAAQCLVTALGSSVYAFALEIGPAGWPAFDGHFWYTVLFCALLGTTVAFLVQTLAQRLVPAIHVAVIYATEPVFAALASWWLLGEELTPRMQAGCGLILCGMLCAALGPWLARRG